MADDGIRVGGGISAGLAVILNGEDGKESSSKTRLVSYCDDFGNQPVERALEYVFGLPNKLLSPLTASVDNNLVRSIIKNEFQKVHVKSDTLGSDRDGICIFDNGCRPHKVGLEELSICGDIRIIKPPFVLESLAMFSSTRANVCVWEGKWMYEVILATSGVQQLGWATVSCPFTDHKGVGDADDSYAFDGKRVRKWNKDAEPYGQSWVVGDVIGCCIDLDQDKILFYRNGVSLGVAFCGIRKMGPGFGYHPAISLSQGERCELNFGGRPFKYPIQGFLPLQEPPAVNLLATELLRALSRLSEMYCMERADSSIVGKFRRLKRFVSLEELFYPVCRGICEELFFLLDSDAGRTEYVAWGPLLSFMMEIFRVQPPHGYSSLDRFIDILLEFQESHLMFECVINALSCGCKTTSLVLTECPYSGSYTYLALACYILRREELMGLWWKLPDFEFLFEGFLSQKSLNKQDLHCLMPSVWWPGSCEDISYESSMLLTTTALSEAVSKIEEKHRDLCLLVIQFVPPTTPPQLPGSVFRTFLQNLLLKKRGADRNVPPPGVSSNSVLVSLYTVILHFLSEGFAMRDICGWLKSCETNNYDVGFLHRGGEQSFPVDLFLKNDSYRTDISRLGGSFSHLSKSHPVYDQEVEAVRWEEGCMDDEEIRVTHKTIQKPCCCSSYDVELSKMSKHQTRYISKGSRVHCTPIPERSTHVAAECSAGSLNDEIADKPSTSDQSESEFGYHPMRDMRIVPRESNMSSDTLREEELLDTLLLLYHIGVAPNFKQASYYMSHQSQSISLLDETDKQIRERGCSEQLRRLKEVRNDYREEVIDCVRHCAWYRISLFSRWKQRGMYATCMWIVQLVLVLSKVDSLFIYIPEFYLETLVDCFHVLRKSDPPFVPPAIFIKQGLASFVTFVVSHFNDPRILSADLRDLLLQSISVLVQYKEYLAAFESNEAAIQRMPKALLSAFDNRSWIPVTNILLRLCKGSRFGSSKHGESSSSSSVVFQNLLREACINDGELFSAFLNRLFNTLSWTMTEFSVSIREMQEKYQVLEFQQRKCCVIFDLSCNLARLLEFCTREIPQAFLSGADTNLRRLTELIVFILSHITSAADSEFFDLSLRRHGQSLEKVNRGMILAPLVGVILNLLDASVEMECGEQNDVVGVFASMDCPDTMHCGFQYLLEYNWAGSFRGEAYLGKLVQLENFLSLLVSRIELEQTEMMRCGGETDGDDSICCICYTCEADAQFAPCSHRSCYGCITRHLLNCHRCFFCNATVLEVIKVGEKST
ncbi:E3 ubiquitin-protein ligase RKP isoform X1 [Ricinus communis]|uniref:E3 ubiquitin-protein ligase RKP isoform X1 n=1 Tax=Ricinus communis TaxID=3988 RepID=UPI00201B2B77|nr:E3 ubiquitin-protein ligase RKP isoform X1 [Ricinus communis]XP_015580548.2 E3 ubiquitin-protein ligase RKP isoform X1 [Ricinus communis]XP_048233420.1 E3 ubiquitin-protein ligase RKP isoform X1 [Ricinus communis]